jgi:threonine synthase
MAEILELQCVVCGRRYAPGAVMYTCPACGEVGTLDVLYNYVALRAQLDRDALHTKQEATLWRYRDLLPVAPATRVPLLPAGWTPLLDSSRLARSLGVRRAWVKDDGKNPTASLKDRASIMVVTRALEQGFRVVTTASTGNAAAALAGVGASVQYGDLDIIIFVPAAAPEAKIAQLLVYGATVLLIEDTYDVAFDLCMRLSQAEGWYCRNTGINPFTTEGKKTVAYEIAEQMGWQVPDVVMTSVGDGSIISGMHKGFHDLYELGWIERIPRLIGVQAAGSSALVHAWEHNLSAADMQPMPAETIADSISAGLPRDRAKALRAVRATAGAFIAVPDEAIIQAIPLLARLTGVFAEPAAAAVYAGAQSAVQSKLISPDEEVVLLVTGSGLKDIRRAQQAVGDAVRIQPDPASVRQALETMRTR